jgi:hypothetical protein
MRPEPFADLLPDRPNDRFGWMLECLEPLGELGLAIAPPTPAYSTSDPK